MRHNSFIFNIFQWFHRHLLQSYKFLEQNKDREGKGKRRQPCTANNMAVRNIVAIYSERGCRRRLFCHTAASQLLLGIVLENSE